MNTDNPMCPSAARVLNAARGILELMYLISSTSYDISLLDQWCLVGLSSHSGEIAPHTLVFFVVELVYGRSGINQIP